MDNIYVTKSMLPSYEEYTEKIKSLWDSHILTNMGAFHQELENKLKEYLSVPEISLMVNGHMALEMAIQSFDFPIGGEVITTPFTFISTTHAIVRNGLVPIFCDVKMENGTIDETKIEALISERTVAILPVHVYGNICNVEEIKKIADKYNLKVIYDAAHAFGETFKGTGIGNFGDVSVFSFHATKVFNTIEGGAVAFQDRERYKKLYNLKNFGIQSEEVVEAIGANAKMNEFCAIMGLCNLKELEGEIAARNKIYDLYLNELYDCDLLDFFSQDTEVKNNYSYFPILLKSEDLRNELYVRLKENGIYTRKYFYPLTCMTDCYRDKYMLNSLGNAVSLSSRVLVLPIYGSLSLSDVRRICFLIKQILEKYRIN